MTLLLAWLAISTGLFSQTTLQGKVTDAESGEAILFGTVALYNNGVLITGTETDFDGFYSITEIDPGTYEVEFAYTGYQSLKVPEVEVLAGKANKLDAKLSSGVTLEAVLVCFSKPLVEQDNTTQGITISSSQIRNLPTRNRRGMASMAAGVNARGSRSKSSDYYIDGVRVSGREARKYQKQNARPPHEPGQEESGFNTEDYAAIVENEFKSVKNDPLSTFSIDVDKASYGNIRRFLNQNQLPPPDAVRIEEMVNYFDYDYEVPKDEHPFSVNTELAPCPWQEGNLLLHIGLQGKKLDMKGAPPSNLVFLLDVSGSMSAPNKLDLVKPAMSLLVKQLRAQDRVAIVVYAGAAGLVLPSTSGAEKEKILASIDSLSAGGSTAGGAGIQLAYAVAKENFIAEGNNRVILATDGDFNIGVSSDGDLTRLIESKRDDGIFLTCIGFGYGNYKDNKLEILAGKGNGNYAYVDNLLEAKKTFVTGLTGTLFTIAKDVKIQIEFNPAVVKAYRLVGYENRLLNKEDFNADAKDAGEIGAGHTVTALYEIVPLRSELEFAAANTDTLKYQKIAATPAAESSGEILTLKLRYKLPEERKSKLITTTVENKWVSYARSSDDFRWSAAVAGFGMMLRESKFKGSLTYENMLEMATLAAGKDKNGDRAECLKLMETAQLLSEAKN